MGSKNYTAAEKHFEKVRVRMQKQIDEANKRAKMHEEESKESKERITFLEGEVRRLTDHNERLMEYMDLPLEDVKAVCERDKLSIKNQKDMAILLQTMSPLLRAII